VIHFAASKAVGESVENPLLYYENNICFDLFVAGLQQKNRSKFYFSSSCTVYGQAETMPITENASIQIAMSPYGNTKQIGKRLSQIRPKSLISTLFCCVISINGSHPSAEVGIAIGSSAKLSTVYYTKLVLDYVN
jgi:UDP-glucose 4-epimerase